MYFVCTALPTSCDNGYDIVLCILQIYRTRTHTHSQYTTIGFISFTRCTAVKYYPKFFGDHSIVWRASLLMVLELDRNVVFKKDMRTIYKPTQRSSSTDLRNSHTQAAVQSMFLFLRTLKLSGGKRKDVRSGDKRNLPTPGRVSL